MTKIKMRFKKGGKIEMDMEGFKGQACLKTAAAIYEAMKEKGIEAKMENFVKKPEMEEEDVTYVEQKELAD